VCVTNLTRGPSIKDVGIFLAVFDTPLPHVRILTLIYLTPLLRYSDVFYKWPPAQNLRFRQNAISDRFSLHKKPFMHSNANETLYLYSATTYRNHQVPDQWCIYSHKRIPTTYVSQLMSVGWWSFNLVGTKLAWLYHKKLMGFKEIAVFCELT
jgi:hypothetical protein